MPYSGRIWIKALTPAIAATILAGLTGCLGRTGGYLFLNEDLNIYAAATS